MPRRELPKLTETDVVFILGKRGSGKTTLAKQLQGQFPRLIIFDRLREYRKEGGDFLVQTFKGFCQAVRETMNRPRFRIIFQFDIEADNHDEIFNQALYICYRRYDCNDWDSSICVVVSEVHNFATPNFVPKWLKESILTGRHQKIAHIFDSQRPANVNKTLLAQSTHLFCANFNEPNDVNYLKDRIGREADSLRELPQFHFRHFSDGKPPQNIGR